MTCWSSAPIVVRSSSVAAGPTRWRSASVFAVVSLTILTTSRYAACPSPVPIVPTRLTGSCQALLSLLVIACRSFGDVHEVLRRQHVVGVRAQLVHQRSIGALVGGGQPVLVAQDDDGEVARAGLVERVLHLAGRRPGRASRSGRKGGGFFSATTGNGGIARNSDQRQRQPGNDHQRRDAGRSNRPRAGNPPSAKTSLNLLVMAVTARRRRRPSPRGGPPPPRRWPRTWSAALRPRARER